MCTVLFALATCGCPPTPIPPYLHPCSFVRSQNRNGQDPRVEHPPQDVKHPPKVQESRSEKSGLQNPHTQNPRREESPPSVRNPRAQVPQCRACPVGKRMSYTVEYAGDCAWCVECRREGEGRQRREERRRSLKRV
ncbi:hypothetical protein IQ07DRAFT_601225 [Pyrenochaeta sp. DS3sAY3a]|nr:hypothetical protein IQ07DRAFT_601225 [Pyrenochaeta sp. DS3sAY3a]